MTMTDKKEDILKKYEQPLKINGEWEFDLFKEEGALLAMDEYAKQQAIAFLKWYGVKMMGFIEYIKDIRPVVTSDEIEEKLKEFEGQAVENLYQQFAETITQ